MANHTGTSTLTVTKNDGTTETLSTANDIEMMVLLLGTNGLEADISTVALSTQADGGAAVVVTFAKTNGADNTDQSWTG